MLRKLFALSYLQVDQPIRIRDRDKLNNNKGLLRVPRNVSLCNYSMARMPATGKLKLNGTCDDSKTTEKQSE